jgi:S-adenosylmethionine synthetase
MPDFLVNSEMPFRSSRDIPRTAEMVTGGHPDKYCDQVADYILDSCLEQDDRSRVAIECLAKNDLIVISGEVTTGAAIDWRGIAQRVYRAVGYGSADRLTVIPCVSQQSAEISTGVDTNGAGDQGITTWAAFHGSRLDRTRADADRADSGFPHLAQWFRDWQ